MKTSKRYTLLSALTILTVLPSIAMAASANVNINVNATVVGSCGINSSTVNYTFLDLDPAVGTNAVNTGSFDTQPQVWCTRGTTFTLTDSGNGAGTLTGTAPNTDTIPFTYTVGFTDASGTPVTQGQGKNTPINIDFKPTILGSEYINKTAGTYKGTVVLTINP